MALPADDVEVVPWQAQIKCFYKLARRKFGRHQHIAENTDALSRNYGLNCVQLLPETEMLEILELRQAAPLASGDGDPSLPSWRLDV